MARRTISCPHCGLVLTFDEGQGSTVISYDPVAWRRLCQHPDLGSPALCLLDGGGRGARGPSNRPPMH